MHCEITENRHFPDCFLEYFLNLSSNLCETLNYFFIHSRQVQRADAVCNDDNFRFILLQKTHCFHVGFVQDGPCWQWNPDRPEKIK